MFRVDDASKGTCPQNELQESEECCTRETNGELQPTSPWTDDFVMI